MSTSIVDIFKAYKNNADGDYNAVATEYATLNIEWIKKIGNQVISADTSWGNATNDLRNLFVLVKGNLTVNAGYTLTAAARKRGMFIYVNGNCTVNGTISMTAKGASAAGARLLLCNIGGSYEVPALGGAGATQTAANNNGNAGTSGAATGACGGGATGGAGGTNSKSLAAGAGTSYSGGAGSGGGAGDNSSGGAGSSNGGAGGTGDSTHENNKAGGGAGNNGGAGDLGDNGGNGTGGLLVIYVTGTITFGASGALTALGIAGGNATSATWRAAGGGGSGGGHIDLFYKATSGTQTLTVTGGLGGSASGGVSGNAGGKGGDGSTRATEVSLPDLFKASNFFIFF